MRFDLKLPEKTILSILGKAQARERSATPCIARGKQSKPSHVEPCKSRSACRGSDGLSAAGAEGAQGVGVGVGGNSPN